MSEASSFQVISSNKFALTLSTYGAVYIEYDNSYQQYRVVNGAGNTIRVSYTGIVNKNDINEPIYLGCANISIFPNSTLYFHRRNNATYSPQEPNPSLNISEDGDECIITNLSLANINNIQWVYNLNNYNFLGKNTLLGVCDELAVDPR